MTVNYQDFSRKVAIAGIGESNIGFVPNRNVMELATEAAIEALDDAGLAVSDVDGLFTGGPGGNSLVSVTEYLGIKPRYIDSTNVGGTSYIIHVGHAMLALMTGMCDVAMIFHGEMARSRVGMPGFASSDATYSGQFDTPFGVGGAITQVAMAALRHMHEYGTTREQLAEICVSTRKWANLNPRALMRDLISVEDVLESRMIAWPFNFYMCCLVTDAAGCVILTTAERAKSLKKPPVYVAGTAESAAHNMVSQMEDMTHWAAAAQNAETVFPMANIERSDIDLAELYDAFAYNPLLAIEGLGFSKVGEGGDFVSNGGTAPGGHFPMNTHGGGLSYTHPGPYGIFPVIEAVRQLRGEATGRQVEDAHHAIVNGMGVGFMSTCGTLVLSDLEQV